MQWEKEPGSGEQKKNRSEKMTSTGNDGIGVKSMQHAVGAKMEKGGSEHFGNFSPTPREEKTRTMWM